MENFVTAIVILVVVIVIIVYAQKAQKAKDREVRIICPRCGYDGTKDTYQKAQSDLLGCFLLALFLIPGIFYYALTGGKIVCPRCKNTF